MPRRKRNPIAVLVPLVLLLAMTSWALIVNLVKFVDQEERVLAPLDASIFVQAMWLIVEAMLALKAAFASRVLPTEQEPVVAGERDDG